MSDIISVENLVEVYADGTKALEGISFNVRDDEFFGFLGPNGAGKSTTIKVLTTPLRKTSGHVSVAGYDLDVRCHLVPVQKSDQLERARIRKTNHIEIEKVV
jgi:ABC-type multidrug transport system ATPase subunit